MCKVRTVKRLGRGKSTVLTGLHRLGQVQRKINDLDEYTHILSSYISFCKDSCIPTRTQVKDTYRSGDKDLYRHAKYKLKRGITAAKGRHAEKLKSRFNLSEFYCRFDK